MEHGSPVVVGWEGAFEFLVGGWVIESIPKDQCHFSTAYVTHLVRVYCARRMRNDDFSPMS
jgi:hypothetical protein